MSKKSKYLSLEQCVLEMMKEGIPRRKAEAMLKEALASGKLDGYVARREGPGLAKVRPEVFARMRQ